MLYYLFEYLEKTYQFPGASLFQFLSFRAAMAILTSLLISTVYGKRIILYLQKKQVGETVRDLGLDGQTQKSGTPTMGGLIIIFATIIPVLLFSKLDNVYIQLLLITTLWMGAIGFLDDYIKVFKKDKEGLKGRFKIIGQVGLGIIVGVTLYFHPQVTIKEKLQETISEIQLIQGFDEEAKSLKTTIPMLKNNEFDYGDLIGWMHNDFSHYAWLIFIPIVVFIITAVSNGANLTDGIDGLAAGSSAIIVLTLGIFAWVSGNIIFSDYLNIMYIPRVSELVIYIAAFVGSLIGFLWYNAFPAQILWAIQGVLLLAELSL